MTNELTVSGINVFVPSKDFELSRNFYEQLGWKTNWTEGGLAEMELGGYRFFLQNYYHKGWANNFMFYINVVNVQIWHEHASEVIAKGNFGKARIGAKVIAIDGN